MLDKPSLRLEKIRRNGQSETIANPTAAAARRPIDATIRKRHRMSGSGTDKTKTGHALEGPVVVLVEPQLGENIGMCARAMGNFGLTRLRLVKPRDGWPNVAAQRSAAGADHILAGSDYPHQIGSIPKMLDAVSRLPVSPAQREGIAGRNAAALLGVK